MSNGVRYRFDDGVGFPRLETAKFTRSRLPRSAVIRPRLIRTLNGFFESPLILICAPAGCGKSTIVSQWLTQVDVPSAWISLDERDSDPIAFLAVALASISKASNRPMADTKQLLESPPAPPHVVLESLFQEMVNWNTRFILILEDYHRIKSPEFDRFLQFMLENAPALLTFVIVSRVEPELSFGRMQAFDGTAFLQEDDLLFTPEEAREFFARHPGAGFAAEDVDRLVAEAHGWAVALQLLATTANRNHAEPDHVMGRVHIDETIANYLIAEVVSLQEPDVQQFLLETSILEVLSTSLCDDLTGGRNAADILESLARNNLFTTAIDRRGSLYRYHPLFREALQDLYEREHSAEELRALHLRASALLEERGLFERAADQAIHAEDWPRALRLVHALVEQWHHEDRLPLILQWTTRFPARELLSDLELNYWHGWAFVRLGKIQEAQEVVTMALAETSVNSDPLSRGRFELVQSYILLALGNWKLGVEFAENARASITGESDHDYTVCLMVLSLLHLASGLPVRAQETIDAARDLIERSHRQIWMRCVEFTLQGRVLFYKSKIVGSISMFEHAIALGEHSNPQVVQYAHFLLAQSSLEILDLDKATIHAEECLQLSESLGNHIHISTSKQLRAEMAAARGDLAEAQTEISEAIEAAEQRGLTYQVRDAKARQARLWLEQERYDLARHWTRGLDVREREVGDPNRFVEDIVSARVLLAGRATSDALRQVETLLELAMEHGRERDRIELLALRAAVWHACDNPLNAEDDLREALKSAEPESILLPFVQHGNCIRPVLVRLQSDDKVGTFARRVVQTVDRAAGRDTNLDLIAALTPREREILECISEGQSNRETADKLFISETTVKKHLNHVYEKLSVKSRTQAVAYFRDLLQNR